MSTLCKWPTMKYVSLACQSNGTAACMTPVMPPIVNSAMRPQANSSGGLKRSAPPHIVASQLKIFTPVGMAISMLVPAMIVLNKVGSPVVNMWCPHTMKPRKPMMPSITIIEFRPNRGLREKTGTTSLITPNAGRIRMYTSGWPKNQKRCCQMIGSPPLAGLKKAVP